MNASSPAFKEWQVIVDALGTGRQSLILRKGGIAEGRDGFQIKHRRFWLFPTRFHAQLEKIKPSACAWAKQSADDSTPHTVTLRYFAQIEREAELHDWEMITKLSPLHAWAETTIRERFESSVPAGIHALFVRVFAAPAPVILPITPSMGGCKSWIELPLALPMENTSPVLDEAAHRGIASHIRF